MRLGTQQLIKSLSKNYQRNTGRCVTLKVRKTFLVDEEDLETIDYNEPTREENLIEKESLLAASNKVLHFDKFKKEQAEALKKTTFKQEHISSSE